MQNFLPLFAEDSKQIEVKAELKPGRHPCLRGEYRKFLLMQKRHSCGHANKVTVFHACSLADKAVFAFQEMAPPGK